MSNIEIKHLLRLNRLPETDISLLLFIAYVPIGLILLLLRVIVLLILIISIPLLPRSLTTQTFVNRIACLAFGISVTVENPKGKENVRIYVSNSLSVLDHIAVTNATSSVSPNKTQLDHYLELSNFVFGNLSDSEGFKHNIQQFLTQKKAPLYFAPEGKVTNGKSLLKFKLYPFQFSTKVQPICLTVQRPFLDVSVTTLGSSYFQDVFYFMFCPTTNYRLRFLAALEKQGLNEEEFADIVRRKIATSLKVDLVDFTSNDVVEWEKRKLSEQHQRTQVRLNQLNPDLQRMTQQVKEVLPHVPFTVIYNDLYKTRSIDNTITNILEGRIYFIPEQMNTASSSSQPASSMSTFSTSGSTSSDKFSFNTAASSFPKSAVERSKSFQERKDQLIANARKRYIEKHNLDIPS